MALRSPVDSALRCFAFALLLLPREKTLMKNGSSRGLAGVAALDRALCRSPAFTGACTHPRRLHFQKLMASRGWISAAVVRDRADSKNERGRHGEKFIDKRPTLPRGYPASFQTDPDKSCRSPELCLAPDEPRPRSPPPPFMNL